MFQLFFNIVHFFYIKQVAQPRVIIALRKVNIEEPKFNQTDPALVIEDKASSMSSHHSKLNFFVS